MPSLAAPLQPGLCSWRRRAPRVPLLTKVRAEPEISLGREEALILSRAFIIGVEVDAGSDEVARDLRAGSGQDQEARDPAKGRAERRHLVFPYLLKRSHEALIPLDDVRARDGSLYRGDGAC